MVPELKLAPHTFCCQLIKFVTMFVDCKHEKHLLKFISMTEVERKEMSQSVNRVLCRGNS